MGSARFDTLTDFYVRKVDVAIRCDGCRYKRFMAVGEMLSIFGAGEKVWNIKRRLKCSKCGHRGASLAPIPRLEPRQ